MRPRRKSVSANSETGGGGEAGKVRSDRRGWGPFSGAQLTIIIVAIAVMVLLPVGAFAVVSGSNAFITDATSGKQAKVTSNGEVLTSARTTTVLSQGTMDVPPLTTINLFTNLNVQPYKSIRLYIGEVGGNPTQQFVSVNMSLVPYVLDNFPMNTANVTRYYETPGANMTLAIANNDNANTATYTWRVYGRTN